MVLFEEKDLSNQQASSGRAITEIQPHLCGGIMKNVAKRMILCRRNHLADIIFNAQLLNLQIILIAIKYFVFYLENKFYSSNYYIFARYFLIHRFTWRKRLAETPITCYLNDSKLF